MRNARWKRWHRRLLAFFWVDPLAPRSDSSVVERRLWMPRYGWTLHRLDYRLLGQVLRAKETARRQALSDEMAEEGPGSPLEPSKSVEAVDAHPA